MISISSWKRECFLAVFGCLLFVFFIFKPLPASATNLYRAYDLISLPYPASSTNHILHFTTAQDVPPGGKIVVDWQPGGLFLPAGFNYQDIDFAVAASGTETFTDRSLAAAADGSNDGVAVITGYGGKITVTLNSTTGLNAHDKIEMEMGTNAAFGGAGDTQIVNAGDIGVYWIDIKTYTATNDVIDNVRTFVIMIRAVGVSAGTVKMRGNGKPDGVLDAETVSTIMSMTTNYDAICRYSMASGTSYYAMTDTFFEPDYIYHTTMIYGLESTKCYAYYVRCYDNETSEVNTDDYVIDFCIAARGSGGTGGGEGGGTGTGTGTGSGTGTGGTSGGGGGGGTGAGEGSGSGVLRPYPIEDRKRPSVTIKGWAYPAGTISVFQDNYRLGQVMAGGNASFIVYVEELQKGIYTFTLSGSDTDGTKALPYPSTFWVEENTLTEISNVILPPTIRLGANTINLGENILVFGQSIPNERVSVELSLPSEDRLISKKEEAVGPDGRWSSFFPTNELTKGIYELKAQAYKTDVGWGVYSEKLKCGVGEKLDQGPCARSDMNKDGKVNLVDFSIMMYHWGTSNEIADLNQDGKVNLVDFSILMYCWTG